MISDMFAPAMASMAAPVVHRGVTLGVVTIAGPMVRLTEERMVALSDALRHTAEEVAEPQRLVDAVPQARGLGLRPDQGWPTIDAVATSSSSSASATLPDIAYGSSCAVAEYLSSSDGFSRATFTWPIDQPAKWRSPICW